MVDAVRAIGKELGIYMRIDMFATTRGAVFGEFRLHHTVEMAIRSLQTNILDHFGKERRVSND